MRLPPQTAYQLFTMFLTTILIVGLAPLPAGSISEDLSFSPSASSESIVLDFEALSNTADQSNRGGADFGERAFQGVSKVDGAHAANPGLTQVPEPSTAILMLLGLLGLGIVGTRVGPDREAKRAAKQSSRA